MWDAILSALILVLVVWLICLWVNGPRMQCRDGMVTNFSELKGQERKKAIEYILRNLKTNPLRSGMGNATDIEENFLQGLYGDDWEKNPEPVQLTNPNEPKPYQLVEAVYGGIPYYLYEWRDLRYSPEWYPGNRAAVMNSKTWFQKTMKLRDADFWNVEREQEKKRIVDVPQVLADDVYRTPVV